MVNYNNSQLSIDCYNSLVIQKEYADLTIVVVDNNSNIEEKEILKSFSERHKDFEVVFNSDNIGYFPAMAKGQEYAYRKGKYDYMLVANNDLIYHEDFVTKLVELNLSDDVMVISPDIITSDGLHQNPHFINRISNIRKRLYRFYFSNWYVSLFFLHLLRFFGVRRHEKNKEGYEDEQQIYMGFGACFILSKSYMERIHLVDTRSFLMGEERLLTLQVEKANGIIKYIPKLKVTHLDSATFKKLPSRFAFENERKAYKLYKDYL